MWETGAGLLPSMHSCTPSSSCYAGVRVAAGWPERGARLEPGPRDGAAVTDGFIHATEYPALGQTMVTLHAAPNTAWSQAGGLSSPGTAS